MSFLFASINRFRDTPGAPPKTQYVLGTGPGGGDGMDFATGSEIFSWSSESVPSSVKPRRIITLWIDASNLTAGKNLIIITGPQAIVVPAGTQTYAIATLNVPFTMRVSTNGGTGTVSITAYDYNVLYTGATYVPAGSSGAGAGSGGGLSSGGSGGGGYQGGGGGGGGRNFK